MGGRVQGCSLGLRSTLSGKGTWKPALGRSTHQCGGVGNHPGPAGEELCGNAVATENEEIKKCGRYQRKSRDYQV